jgi:hypothetical protein
MQDDGLPGLNRDVTRGWEDRGGHG